MNTKHSMRMAAFCCALIFSLIGCGGGGGGGGGGGDQAPVVPSNIIFSDSFSDGDDWQNRWMLPVDETGNGAVWEVTASSNGELRQNINAARRAFLTDSSYRLGSYVVLDPSLNTSPSSYFFSTDIRPLSEDPPDRSGGNDVGIMFGYVNDKNYYRVTMNAQEGFTRFEKRTGNTFETLAVNARGYVDDQPMTMAAEINGTAIIVWIDGEPVFAKVDPSILSGTVALYCQDRAQFDNVLITGNPGTPTVAISSPLAYSVDVDNSFTAQAVVLNMPTGGSVAFSLNGDIEIPATGSGNVYSLDFPIVGIGNNDIAAIVRDAGGAEVASDINSMVGTGGDYYVSVGDSITNGIGDDDSSNNDSTDGRIVATQGFQARLNNRLTDTTNRPQVVFNEGIPGDKTSDLKQKIDSILERHPGANKVLMMIGTNDAGPGTLADDYKVDVSAIVDKMNGRELWLATPMPIFRDEDPMTWTLDDERNTFIQQYSLKLIEIAAGSPMTSLGPDFYTDFPADSDHYDDNVHPNDKGYRTMADQWYDVF